MRKPGTPTTTVATSAYAHLATGGQPVRVAYLQHGIDTDDRACLTGAVTEDGTFIPQSDIKYLTY